MSLPQVVSREDWLAARLDLLAREKELTRARDALNADRRRLPMVKIETDYRFQGPAGDVGLPDLFDSRHQLFVRHFMFDPTWDDGCPSCSAAAAEISDGLLEHLHTRDTSFVTISRAPLAKLEEYKRRQGWEFPWYSSSGSDFNYDFHVTLDSSVTPMEYNYRGLQDPQAAGEQPGHSCFLRVGDEVFHTYSMFARGARCSAALTTGWTSPRSGAKRIGRSRRAGLQSARSAAPDFAD